jgi:hypothetical protein
MSDTLLGALIGTLIGGAVALVGVWLTWHLEFRGRWDPKKRDLYDEFMVALEELRRLSEMLSYAKKDEPELMDSIRGQLKAKHDELRPLYFRASFLVPKSVRTVLQTAVGRADSVNHTANTPGYKKQPEDALAELEQSQADLMAAIRKDLQIK